MIVVLCDGSSKGNPGPASIGVIIWDRCDNPRITKPTYHWHKDLGVKTNMEAEWSAVLSALRFLEDKGLFKEIHLFSDSQTVVKQITGEWQVKHDNIKPLYQAYLALKGFQKNLTISWIPRQLVYLADKEAQK